MAEIIVVIPAQAGICDSASSSTFTAKFLAAPEGTAVLEMTVLGQLISGRKAKPFQSFDL